MKKRRKNKQETETRHKTQETLSIVYMYIFVKIALISNIQQNLDHNFLKSLHQSLCQNLSNFHMLSALQIYWGM